MSNKPDFWEGYVPEPVKPAPMPKDEFMEPLGCVVVRPLVANSTTPQPAQRKPLTSEEVSDLRIKHGITSNGRGIKEFTQIVDFVRDIEAAHKIKEKNT